MCGHGGSELHLGSWGIMSRGDHDQGRGRDLGVTARAPGFNMGFPGGSGGEEEGG